MPDVMQMYPTTAMSLRGFVLLSSSNSMTFNDYFHDLFKVPMTFSLAVSLKPSLSYFLTLQSSTDTNSGVHQNVCRS